MTEHSKARSLSPGPRSRRGGGSAENNATATTTTSRGRRPPPAAASRNSGERRGRSHSPALQAKSVPVSVTRPPTLSRPPNLLEHGYGNLPLQAIKEHDDDGEFLIAVKRCIPSEFVLIASQDDVSEAQEDYYAMDHYHLKPPDGRPRWSNSELAGSVATCALLQLMYENPKAMVARGAVANGNDDSTEHHHTPWSALDILQEIQQRIKTCSRLDANPTISASRPLGPPRFDEGVYAPYQIVPPNYVHGKRRALLIGCVSGGENLLKAALNDVHNIHRFLVTHCGFQEENIVSLEESIKVPLNRQPTKKNIVDGFAKLIKESKPGDVNFIQFSGHGNRSDTNLYIMPSDWKQNGCIMDDKILKNLIKAMAGGVFTTMLVDCCYSGTIADLPYILKPGSTEQEIEGNFDTSVSTEKIKQNKPIPTTRPRPMPRQSVQSFYNTDTLKETLEKEATGGEEYEKLEKARKQKRTWMQFEPKKLLDFNAAKHVAGQTKRNVLKGFNAVGQAAHEATEMAIEATAHASDKVIDVTKMTTSAVSSRLGRSKSPVPVRMRDGGKNENLPSSFQNQERSKSPAGGRRINNESKSKTIRPKLSVPKVSNHGDENELREFEEAANKATKERSRKGEGLTSSPYAFSAINDRKEHRTHEAINGHTKKTRSKSPKNRKRS